MTFPGVANLQNCPPGLLECLIATPISDFIDWALKLVDFQEAILMNFALTFLMFLISFASLTYNVRNIRISSRKLTHERQLVNELTEQVNRMSDDYLRLKSEYDEVSFEYWGAMQQISKIRADFESKSDPEF